MTFHPGDTVRVLSHAPHGTRLLAGDEVTVAQVKRDTEDRTVLLVDTDDGTRALYATDVEVVRRAYRPAAPDPAINDAFVLLMLSDGNLAEFLVEANSSLGEVDAEVSALLTAEHEDDDGDYEDGDGEETVLVAEVVRFEKPADDPTSVLTITDPWGDAIAFIYEEAHASDGGVIGRVMLYTEAENGVQIRDNLPALIAWLQEKAARTADE